jgi:hypothetical protein
MRLSFSVEHSQKLLSGQRLSQHILKADLMKAVTYIVQFVAGILYISRSTTSFPSLLMGIEKVSSKEGVGLCKEILSP